MTDLIRKYRPTVPKRTLFLIAAFAWTFAGIMLLIRGSLVFYKSPSWPILTLVSLCAGLLMYVILFSRISMKLISRIVSMPDEDHCLFSFFSIRSYLMMVIMISAGIIVRHSSLISREYLATVYNTMATPLLLSAVRFYSSFRNY
ncbi:MAG TPA: hypothetical protein VK213_14285 [Bacteroidales bacterium]|nr:hypothetical protein [Bacteroidales bacterium]